MKLRLVTAAVLCAFLAIPGGMTTGRSAQAAGDSTPYGHSTEAEEIDRFVTQRRRSQLGVWPPLLALRDAEPGDEWMTVARAIAGL